MGMWRGVICEAGAMSRWRFQLLLDAADLVLDILAAIDPGAETHVGRDARHALNMEGLVAPFHGREDLVPLALHVGAVSVQACGEARLRQNPFAQSNLGRHRNPDSERDDAYIRNHMHIFIVPAATASG